jgi:hypothetical protein
MPKGSGQHKAGPGGKEGNPREPEGLPKLQTAGKSFLSSLSNELPIAKSLTA